MKLLTTISFVILVSNVNAQLYFEMDYFRLFETDVSKVQIVQVDSDKEEVVQEWLVDKDNLQLTKMYMGRRPEGLSADDQEALVGQREDWSLKVIKCFTQAGRLDSTHISTFGMEFVSFEDGSCEGDAWLVSGGSKSVYNDAGNFLGYETINEKGRREQTGVRYIYNEKNLLDSIYWPERYSWNWIVRDEQDRMKEFRRGSIVLASFEYNEKGLRSRIKCPETTITFTYDSLGFPAEMKVDRGRGDCIEDLFECGEFCLFNSSGSFNFRYIRE